MLNLIQGSPNEPDIRRLLHYHTSWTANEDTGCEALVVITAKLTGNNAI